MKAPDLSLASIPPSETPQKEQKLHSGQFVLARVLWGIVITLTLIIVIGVLPAYFTQLHTVCNNQGCNGYTQLTPDQLQVLANLHLSIDAYTFGQLVFNICAALAWFAIAVVIFWYKPNDRMALLASLATFVQGASNFTGGLNLNNSPWFHPNGVLGVINMVTLFLLLSFFPNGRVVPRWLLWLIIPWSVWQILTNLFTNTFSFLNPFSFLVFISFLAMLAIAQIYRYRRVSTLTERQQTRWIIFSLLLLVVAQIVLVTLATTVFSVNSIYFLLAPALATLFLLLIPISLGISILRHRLWDIDILINKTLVYGLLTGILTLIYFVCVIGLQHLLESVAGTTVGNSQLIIVGSTLIIAALFQPLRRYIQKIIDRRFYRRKYDAAKTIAAFSGGDRSCDQSHSGRPGAGVGRAQQLLTLR